MKKGFSIIEGAVVILMIGIVSMTVQVGTTYAKKQQFKAVVEEIAIGTSYAQQMAIATGQIYECLYKKDEFYIRIKANGKVKGKRIKTFKLPDDYFIEQRVGDVKVIFGGSAAPHLAQTIKICSPALNSQARITVRIATGKTTIYYDKI